MVGRLHQHPFHNYVLKCHSLEELLLILKSKSMGNFDPITEAIDMMFFSSSDKNLTLFNTRSIKEEVISSINSNYALELHYEV
jgi:hypothetical protein